MLLEFQTALLPMPSEFQSKKPSFPSEFQDAALGVGMDIFWSHPFLLMNK